MKDSNGNYYQPTTADQKLYEVNGRLKAEIDVYVTPEGTPSIKTCRHAVLPLGNTGYVVYDRLLSRIVNGVFYETPEVALEVAQSYNNDPGALQNMAPNGEALGLIYPK